jgi:hypothetical protein
MCFADRRVPIALRFHASRKPGATIHGRPFDACVSPLGAAGKTFCAFAFPASRRKPVVCLSVANPARRMRRALFFTLRETHADQPPAARIAGYTGPRKALLGAAAPSRESGVRLICLSLGALMRVLDRLWTPRDEVRRHEIGAS